jgi:glycine/D-amino acid oxidase-like deaminating enzyme
MKDIYDVIVTGGGIMGCATAYHLMKADQRLRVAILEKDPTYARASTTLSDGNIRVQFNLKENIQISQYGLQVIETFADDMAVGDEKPEIAYRRQGDLFLYDNDGIGAAKLGFELQQDLGCDVLWLSPAEIKERYPQITTDKIAAGTLGSNEGTMDPHAVLQAYKKKAISLGAEYLQAEVASLTAVNGVIDGVKLAGGQRIRGGVVVNSAGPWLPLLARSVGILLPIEPVKRQVFVLQTHNGQEDMQPLIVFPSGLYLIQEHKGQFYCGKSLADDPVTATDFSWHQSLFETQLWPELVEYIPSFDRLKVVSGWAGLYAVNTFDGNAILGEWPEMSGLYIIGGFSGHGFQQAFAVGRYIAELILGQKPFLDLTLFSPQRILDNQPVFENPNRLV